MCVPSACTRPAYVNLPFPTPYGLASNSSLLHSRESTSQRKQWVTMTRTKWCKQPFTTQSWHKFWNKAWKFDSSSSQDWVTFLWPGTEAVIGFHFTLLTVYSDIYVIEDKATKMIPGFLIANHSLPFHLSHSSHLEVVGDNLFKAPVCDVHFSCI